MNTKIINNHNSQAHILFDFFFKEYLKLFEKFDSAV